MKKIINTNIYYFLTLALILCLAVLFSSCKNDNPVTPPPPEPPKAVTLKLVDVSCTEAFIKVTVSDSVLPLSISLNKDDSTIANFTLTKTDTVVIDTILQPNHIYTYQTTEIINGKEEKSDTLNVKSLNITSNNYTWQTFTFGNPDYGSSLLRDVAIIDENKILAVGEIYNDTTGQAYNAVHWDGTNWELKRIYYYGACSAVMYPPLNAIYAFSENNIVLTNGGSIGWFDGNSVILDCGVNPLLTGAINRIWGSNSNDLYVVGNNGNIAHYNGQGWQRIESGTTTNINDIWGINDSSANNSLVLCTVSSRYQLGDYKLLSISGNTATEYIAWPYTRLYGVWFNSLQKIYIVGSGAYVYRNNSLKTINLSTNYFLTRVKGNALNDIYISASDAQVFHYNGINWSEVFNGIYGGYEGMEVKGNTVVLVGYNIEGGMVGKAVVTIGKHY